MAKALLISDLHIHAHKQKVDRLYDCLKVLDWAFEKAVENKCEYMLFLGDLFHERTKIDVLNYLRTFEVFMKYSSYPLQIYLLVGNHDMYHKESWEVNSIKPLTALTNVHIVDKPTTIKIGNTDIDFLPYIENPIESLKNLKKDRNKEDLRLLLGHLAVHGATLNTLYGTTADVVVEYDTGMILVNPEIFDDWDMTILGHYHGAQNLNSKVEYLGSPLQLSFGEAFQDKHIAVIDLDTLEKEYIVNNFSPKHYIIGKELIPKYDLKNAFVRVVIDDLPAEELLALKTELLEEKKVASFDFKKKEKKEEDQIDVEKAKAIFYNQDEMLERWIEANVLPPNLTKDKLLEIGKLIISKS